ncbi:ABC transporter ATP-binding protein [Burkholderia plantarii]|uniref:Uncharacterized protein n=1 Tax=Burkholderia plantarii TaxID=41899 RepID=A0A0B6RR94_BURPL|nr:ABC transporter ATP-binding protein [Burkholderia plantarii]AJK45883.1 hypothetical protein BGL_1c13630 [Burkholderia plantarii]
MNSFEINPLKGVDTLEFGMSPAQVRGVLNVEFESFKRSPAAACPCDYFPNLGVFGYYTGEGKLEALEFALPSQVLLDGRNLLSVGFDAATSLLKAKDEKLEHYVDMVIAHAVGVSLYAPQAEESPGSPCESVLVFAEGYYNL